MKRNTEPERACFIYLDKEGVLGRFTQRVYCGSEFCDRRIPSVEALRGVERYFYPSSKVRFTYVTPIMTDAAFDVLMKTLSYLDKLNPYVEVVINDYGVLDLLIRHYPRMGRVMGRVLLSKEIDSRNSYKDSFKALTGLGLPKARREEAGPLLPSLLSFWKERGVERVEFNGIDDLCRCSRQLHDEGIRASLYYPYSYITITRYCYWGSRHQQDSRLSIVQCDRSCEGNSATLKTKAFPWYRFYLKWNTLFLRDKRRIETLSRGLCDRLVLADF